VTRGVPEEPRAAEGARRALAASLLAGVLLTACGEGLPVSGPEPTPTPTPEPLGPPNIILIVADDLGYTDLSGYGAPLIQTPHLDRLAEEGLRFTNFTVPAPVCTPSRASLITGRYPVRSGLVWILPSGPPDSGITTGPGSGGIDTEEITVAEVLRDAGYATGMVGKWHLGHQAEYLPTHHGFGSYFGIPSGQNGALTVRGDSVTEPEDWLGLDLVSRRYNEEAIEFIRQHSGGPFFLYLAHKAPHVPLAVSGEFLGRSAAGLYGDVVEELDWTIGQLVDFLDGEGLLRNTLIFFFSDNGPWLAKGDHAGSSTPLRGGKGSPWEGGIRGPAIAYWPAGLDPGREISERVSSLDLFPTFVGLAGAELPRDRPYDGRDVWDLLSGEIDRLPGTASDGGRELVTYYGNQPAALHSGDLKYVAPGWWSPHPHLFDLSTDLTESRNLVNLEPDLAAALAQRLDELWGEHLIGARRPQQ